AEALESMGVNIDKVISLEVADETIQGRLSGRRVCEKCGASYHVEFNPPKTEGICDKCGGNAVQRKDDAPETVIERLRTYHEQTAPLVDFYGKKGKLVTVQGQDEVKATSELVLKAVTA
ncbi:MAG: nucleoside monophosphate kinase, partial [Oscillospiraceae bacterium]|nr:nucleoside monophosphate kinase [Oscillospiraceae bacterium]